MALKFLSTRQETGVSLIEVLVALVIFSIMGLTIAYSTIVKMNAQAKNIRQSLALQIALDSIESFAAIDPDTLDDDDDVLSETVTRQDVDFTRSIDVTIEADRTRTVQVTVRNDAYNTQVQLSNSFALWNRR